MEAARLSAVIPHVQRKCDCAAGGDCGCGGKKKVQKKSRAPAAYDAFEEEADRFAAREGDRLDLRDLRRPNLPGHDFSRVRIHDDSHAHARAHDEGARAFTYGSDIYFARGELARPDARQLLAHELAHTVQQGAATTVRRKVITDYDKLKNLLSTSFFGFDWKVFDSEAHAALELLDRARLSGSSHLADTVARMEKDGLVDTLFDNVSDEDRFNYGELLQAIQNARVHEVQQPDGKTSTVVDSCTPALRKRLDDTRPEAADWLAIAANKVREFLSDPKTDAARKTGAALQRHFHSTDAKIAGHVQSRLSELASDINSNTVLLRCTAPTDAACESNANAYRSTTDIHFCPQHFQNDTLQQVETYIHEHAHAHLVQIGGTEGVTDRGYLSERVYTHLSPAEALDNADSYSEFVIQVAQGTDDPGNVEQDSVVHCDARSQAKVVHALAWTERWVLNAQTAVYDDRPDFRQSFADLQRTHFGTDSDKALKDLRKRYDAVIAKFHSSISVECMSTGGTCGEKAEKTGITGYYNYFILTSDTLNVCPSFFVLDDTERIASMFQLAVMNVTGLDSAEARPYALFARDLNARFWPPPPPLPK